MNFSEEKQNLLLYSNSQNIPNFQYALSNILKNLYDSYSKGEINSIEKSEIKKIIFSKDSAISNIIEELKNPKLFNYHLTNLKSMVIKLNKKREILSNRNSNNKSSTNIDFDKEYFFIEQMQAQDQSLLMDSNESIYFLEKTHQNLFSEAESENLSTTLGLTFLINESTNPSTPLNVRVQKGNKVEKNKKVKKHKKIDINSKYIYPYVPNNFPSKIDVGEIKKKILIYKSYKSDQL